ncbi:MAG: hypothetical protein ACKVHE_33710 [Planctomycetales bacterium]|jgi:hypothetical protein
MRTLIPVLLVIPLTQFSQLVATLQATFVKRVAWRGSILEINGPNNIRVIDDPAAEVSQDNAVKAA